MTTGSTRGTGTRSGVALALLAVAVAAGLGHAAVHDSPRTVAVSAAPARTRTLDVAPRSRGLDSLTGLAEVAAEIEECTGPCSGVIYSWSPRMPLSRTGIEHITAATERLGLRLTLIGAEELHGYAYPDERPALRTTTREALEGGRGAASGRIQLADAMLDAGVLAHAPALVVHEGGRLLGPAILGYKSARAYQAILARRLTGSSAGRRADGSAASVPAGAAKVPAGAEGSADAARAARGTALAAGASQDGAHDTVPGAFTDYGAVGTPGAYFRWVPGRNALAYESGQRVYLLDLADGRSRLAPGQIDFIPTPDGEYFVTPGPTGRPGLRFYDADEVFEAALAGRSEAVEPIFADRRMRDQYPSVGILEQGESRTVYRVLTSWFDGVAYRDYEVRGGSPGEAPRVRPLAEPVVPCSRRALSTPIVSQDGTEVAARDEGTGTTKIFRILPGGACDEALDVGVATSKVAWHRSGRVLAFAVPPRTRRGDARGDRGADGADGAGVFLFERDQRRTTRVADSGDASLFAFPDFIDDESLVFLTPGSARGGSSVFRVVDGIR